MKINFFFFLYIGISNGILLKNTCDGGNFYSKRTLRCLPCPRGRFGNLGTCVTCPPGKYNSVQGSEGPLECRLCEPGTYSDSHGNVQCDSVCPSGKYSTKWGSASENDCKECPEGLASFQCGFDIQKSYMDLTDPRNKMFESYNFVDQYYQKPINRSKNNNKCGGLYNVCMNRHIQ